MNDTFEKDVFYIWIIFWSVVIVIVLLGGCLPCLKGEAGGNLPNIPNIPGTNDTMKSMLKAMNWVATLSVLGIGLGAFALLNGNKLGFAGIGASLVMLFTTAAMTKYSAWIAWFGLAFSLVGVVSICIYSILIKNNALKEIITNVQRVKDSLSDEQPGKKLLKQELDKQSVSTRKLVQKVKGQLKIKGTI